MRYAAQTIIAISAVLLCIFCSIGIAQPSIKRPSQATKNGQRIFAQSCASCHDANTNKTKIGPGLKGYYTTHHPRPVDSSVRGIIAQGKGTMPGFSRSLSSSQTDDLIAYLKTLR